MCVGHQQGNPRRECDQWESEIFILTTINFRFLTIESSEEGIQVVCGISKGRLRWSDIKSCEKDEKGFFYGFDVRFGRYKKEWVWIYNVIGVSRWCFWPGRKTAGIIIFPTIFLSLIFMSGAGWNELAVELLSVAFAPILALAVISTALAYLVERRHIMNRKNLPFEINICLHAFGR